MDFEIPRDAVERSPSQRAILVGAAARLLILQDGFNGF
jgi:hypothetical protein